MCATGQTKVNDMMDTIDSILLAFRPCFTREAAFSWFLIVVFSFMLRTDSLGVSSVIRDLLLPASCYLPLLHFFRANSWSLDVIREKWCEIVANRANLMRCNGKAILVGDGVKQSKEGLRMPGVTKLAQESGTVSKPDYIFGHMFGSVGVILQGEGLKKFCLPLFITIQQGLWFLHLWNGMDKEPPGSHVEQVIDCAGRAARVIGTSYLVLDRYFTTVKALLRLERFKDEHGSLLLRIVTRAKSNFVAYEQPVVVEGKRGRKPRKGAAVHLKDLFDTELFQRGQAMMYGRMEEVEYCHKILLWGKNIYQPLLFVLVKWKGQTAIYVCTDLELDPIKVIELYAVRFSIEETFREFKQRLFGFAYHFWCKHLPKLNRFAKTGEPSSLQKVTLMDDDERRLEAETAIRRTVKAIEGYVLFASIAMGILQMLALDKKIAFEAVKARYLRTPSKKTPSEATIMYCLVRKLTSLLLTRPDLSIVAEIMRKRMSNPDGEAAA